MAANLSKAIENKIKADFPLEYHEEIMRLITHSGFEGIDKERIQNAILTLSEGNIDRFHRCIEIAKFDWRDILLGAENRILGWGVRRDIRKTGKGSPPDRAYGYSAPAASLVFYIFLGVIVLGVIAFWVLKQR